MLPVVLQQICNQINTHNFILKNRFWRVIDVLMHQVGLD